VSTVALPRKRAALDPLVAAATDGDESAFAQLVRRHRRELHAHAFRMLGSHEDSEDVTQEAFLRAWRMRASYEGRSSFRSWLLRIGTNACLDALERRARRRQLVRAREPVWPEQDPDPLERAASTDPGPDALVVSREATERALLVAIQHVPPSQRAVLTLRDVFGWSAKDTAELLDRSVVSVNSALQRARATLRDHLVEHGLEWAPRPDPTAEERALLRRYLEAVESVRPDTVAATVPVRATNTRRRER
jgi:RNA polymerase sigma-70 factor (ECF subfamily)